MKELRRLFTLVLILLNLGLLCTCAQAQDKILCYTTWDEFYFYIAFQVDDSDVTGKSTEPNSNPWSDDCCEVFIETDNKHATNRTPQTFSMAVSPAGGSGFTVGVDGNPKQAPVVTYKYAQTVQGTLNDPDDTDVGYQIEMAIPWQTLGKIPKPGMMISFNIVCRHKGADKGFFSLAPDIKNEADIQNPSKWVNMVLTPNSFGAATLDLKKIVCARYITRRPTIDGKIGEKEYNKNTSFAMVEPERPGDAEKKRPKRSLQKLVFTRYIYNYQGDPRKAAPQANVRFEDGRSQLTHFPALAAGPWFSFDRVEWHKQELSEMRKSGIDVVLPVYRGDKKSRAEYSIKGLDCMVQAMRELRNERKEYPLVGLFFDTDCLAAAYGGKFDLKVEQVKKTLYGMISDFFLRVPAEFRAQVQLTDDKGGKPAYVIFMGPSDDLAGCDDSFVSYVNDRFYKEYGRRLVWILPSGMKTYCKLSDGYCAYPAGMSLKYDETGMIRVGAVGPGHDDSAVKKLAMLRARKGGETYKADWSVLTAKRPNWVLVDSWNDFKAGSEVCGTRQFGYAYPDLTTLCVGKSRGSKEYDAKFLSHDAPDVITPGVIYQVRLLLQNDGIKPWKAAEGYAVGYKWFKDGRPVDEGIAKRPLQEDVLPGKTSEVTIGLAAVVKGNQPLSEGNYEVYYEVIRMADGKWFSAFGDEPFIAPVTVGKPRELAMSVQSTDVPSMMKSGGDYVLKVTVRNDGTSAWTKDAFQVGCRLWKVSNYTNENKVDAEHPEGSNPLILTLPRDVQPGESIELEGIFSAKDIQGQPLPVWSPEESSSYVLRWQLIKDSTQWIADAGSYDEAVGIYASDPGCQFIAADTPAEMDAGKAYNVKVMVKNRGAETWTPGKHKIGYHWYYLDGTEAQWDCQLTELKKPLAPAKNPGDLEFVTAKVVAPKYDGQYILVWDMLEGDTWASTAPISRGGDMLPTFVEVKNGNLSFVDLSKMFDLAACTPETNPASADFDGQGRSFPAEHFPPDVPVVKTACTLYPSGYYRSPVKAGEDSQRKISFNFGPNTPGQKNAVVCAGQAVPVKAGSYSVLHVLGASTEPDTRGKIVLNYGTVSDSADIKMSAWTDEPKNGEMIGYQTLHIHGKDGDIPGTPGYLHHYVIKLDPSRKLTGLTLPNNNKMRVVALTLEKG